MSSTKRSRALLDHWTEATGLTEVGDEVHAFTCRISVASGLIRQPSTLGSVVKATNMYAHFKNVLPEA